eukprot:scaffold166413_cov45-Prasinocladus_malaysianus.AAC.1
MFASIAATAAEALSKGTDALRLACMDSAKRLKPPTAPVRSCPDSVDLRASTLQRHAAPFQSFWTRRRRRYATSGAPPGLAERSNRSRVSPLGRAYASAADIAVYSSAITRSVPTLAPAVPDNGPKKPPIGSNARNFSTIASSSWR